MQNKTKSLKKDILGNEGISGTEWRICFYHDFLIGNLQQTGYNESGQNRVDLNNLWRDGNSQKSETNIQMQKTYVHISLHIRLKHDWMRVFLRRRKWSDLMEWTWIKKEEGNIFYVSTVFLN